MPDQNTVLQADVLDNLQKTIDLMLEHNRKGYSIDNMLFHAQKQVAKLVAQPAVSVVAGYVLNSDGKTFYPVGFRPTDINNFSTLVYANGDEHAPAAPHYVLRFVDKVGGEPGNSYGIVSVASWNAGLSRALGERICDEQGVPLEVYPRPVVSAVASA